MPAVNIKTLIDATRKDIIGSFHSHLIDNSAVPVNATIIFYFAGHGSRVDAPKGWETRAVDGQIETLCPADHGKKTADGTPIPGIPDLTINALLSQLAVKKGDNVVSIIWFDCYDNWLTFKDRHPGLLSRGGSCPWPFPVAQSART